MRRPKNETRKEKARQNFFFSVSEISGALARALAGFVVSCHCYNGKILVIITRDKLKRLKEEHKAKGLLGWAVGERASKGGRILEVD